MQSIFDLATSIIGPPDGLVADVLRGLKNVGQKLKKAGTDFAKGAEHGAPKPTAGEPPKPPEGAPKPEPGKPGAKPTGAPKPTTIDEATWMAGRPVTGGVRQIKNADGSLSMVVRLDDGTFARAEARMAAGAVADYEVLRLSGDGIPEGTGTVLFRDTEWPGGPVYVRQPEGTKPGFPGGARPAPAIPVPEGFAPELGLRNQAGTPFKPGSYGHGFANKPYEDMETDHFPPYGSYAGTPYAFVADTRMPAVNLPKSLHQFERDFGYAGNYATSTGATKIAKDYRSQLQQLMRDGRYGEAMLKDLDDKINLIIYNRDHIPARSSESRRL